MPADPFHQRAPGRLAQQAEAPDSNPGKCRFDPCDGRSETAYSD